MLFLVIRITIAQDYVDLVKLNYVYAPTSTNSAGGSSVRVISGDLTFPIVINSRTTLLTGIAFENIRTSFRSTQIEESVTGLTAKLGVNVKHNTRLNGTYMLLPNLSSDLQRFTTRDWQLGGIVLMKYAKTNYLNYKFGLYANTELFGPLIVPLFGIYYSSPSKQFEANILLPLSIDLNHLIAEQTRVGIKFTGEVRTYNLHTPVENESQRYLEKNSNDIYTYLQYAMKNGVHIQLGVGRSIGRSFDLYEEEVSFGIPLAKFGDNRTKLNAEGSDSWLLKATVFYRLQIGDSTDAKM
jgi:hypothetical protein